jgi:hypothetical protein
VEGQVFALAVCSLITAEIPSISNRFFLFAVDEVIETGLTGPAQHEHKPEGVRPVITRQFARRGRAPSKPSIAAIAKHFQRVRSPPASAEKKCVLPDDVEVETELATGPESSVVVSTSLGTTGEGDKPPTPLAGSQMTTDPAPLKEAAAVLPEISSGEGKGNCSRRYSPLLLC